METMDRRAAILSGAAAVALWEDSMKQAHSKLEPPCNPPTRGLRDKNAQ